MPSHRGPSTTPLKQKHVHIPAVPGPAQSVLPVGAHRLLLPQSQPGREIIKPETEPVRT